MQAKLVMHITHTCTVKQSVTRQGRETLQHNSTLTSIRALTVIGTEQHIIEDRQKRGLRAQLEQNIKRLQLQQLSTKSNSHDRATGNSSTNKASQAQIQSHDQGQKVQPGQKQKLLPSHDAALISWQSERRMQDIASESACIYWGGGGAGRNSKYKDRTKQTA